MPPATQPRRDRRSSSGPAVASPAPRPFIKWVGGKRQLLGSLLPHVPRAFGTYHEPFVGGGALFFELRPRAASLSDVNARLVRTYLGIRDHVETVIDLLKSYPHDREFYLRMRQIEIDRLRDADVAA